MAWRRLERFSGIVLLVGLFNLFVSYPKSASLHSFKVSPLRGLLFTEGRNSNLALEKPP